MTSAGESSTGGTDLDEAGASGGSRRVPLYKVYPSSNHYGCGGRAVAGPDWHTFAIAFAATVIPQIVFVAGLMDDVAETLATTTAGRVVLVIAVLAVLAVMDISLVLARYTDPGIVPRQARADDEARVWTRAEGELVEAREVVVGREGETVAANYCETCRLYRPPRASHCGVCDNCVLHFDHHCPWTGNCVGLRNYKYYLAFVWSTTLGLTLIIALCLSYLFEVSSGSEQTALGQAGSGGRPTLALVLIVYAVIIVWPVGGLAVFHIYLVAAGRSTKETIKGLPYQLYGSSGWRNLARVLCMHPPAALDFTSLVPAASRAYRDEDDETRGSSFVDATESDATIPVLTFTDEEYAATAAVAAPAMDSISSSSSLSSSISGVAVAGRSREAALEANARARAQASTRALDNSSDLGPTGVEAMVAPIYRERLAALLSESSGSSRTSSESASAPTSELVYLSSYQFTSRILARERSRQHGESRST
ncbi:zinc ion binding protein [Thecamonas trahens ATCC 50062]|uniref:Palmitoyltransferase n=1 Tax=Thecamonas trahens ATCC 50062 TaxID=461836 RepID=A0A0L0D5L9_THETB|nr:zinc ion binding protein [Thecamonas trahens ATCC 50062]KNC47639.1 zinc ion binding protein [Thecamonas trahens ATCC 50062]|eukprot:XP_013759123.1 zinc ion binding protein [Thecamonas trahens ATCC 50062]